MKRILSFILALTLLCGILPAASASEASGRHPFADVPSGAWYEQAVQFCYDQNILKGVTDTQFSPSGAMTRAMLVTMLWRMEGEPAASAQPSFTDVPADSWYADAVAWAVENDITTGVDAATFAPGSSVTREQFVTFLYRFYQSKGYPQPETVLTLNKFQDRNLVREFALPAVRWAVTVGVLNGIDTTVSVYAIPKPLCFTESYLCGSDSTTRAQAAKILVAFCALTDGDPANDPTPGKEGFTPSLADLSGDVNSEQDVANVCNWLNQYIETTYGAERHDPSLTIRNNSWELADDICPFKEQRDDEKFAQYAFPNGGYYSKKDLYYFQLDFVQYLFADFPESYTFNATYLPWLEAEHIAVERDPNYASFYGDALKNNTNGWVDYHAGWFTMAIVFHH